MIDLGDGSPMRAAAGGRCFTSSNAGCLEKSGNLNQITVVTVKGGNQGRSCFFLLFFVCFFVDVFRDVFCLFCFFLGGDLFSFLRFLALKTCFYTVMF